MHKTIQTTKFQKETTYLESTWNSQFRILQPGALVRRKSRKSGVTIKHDNKLTGLVCGFVHWQIRENRNHIDQTRDPS